MRQLVVQHLAAALRTFGYEIVTEPILLDLPYILIPKLAYVFITDEYVSLFYMRYWSISDPTLTSSLLETLRHFQITRDQLAGFLRRCGSDVSFRVSDWGLWIASNMVDIDLTPGHMTLTVADRTASSILVTSFEGEVSDTFLHELETVVGKQAAVCKCN